MLKFIFIISYSYNHNIITIVINTKNSKIFITDILMYTYLVIKYSCIHNLYI